VSTCTDQLIDRREYLASRGLGEAEEDGSSDGGISFDEDDEAIDATTIDDENVPLGGEDWRQLAHSVPNLRIYRVEKAKR